MSYPPACHLRGDSVERDQRCGRARVEQAAAQRFAVEREAEVKGAARPRGAALALFEQLNMQLRSVCAHRTAQRESSTSQLEWARIGRACVGACVGERVAGEGG